MSEVFLNSRAFQQPSPLQFPPQIARRPYINPFTRLIPRVLGPVGDGSLGQPRFSGQPIFLLLFLFEFEGRRFSEPFLSFVDSPVLAPYTVASFPGRNNPVLFGQVVSVSAPPKLSSWTLPVRPYISVFFCHRGRSLNSQFCAVCMLVRLWLSLSST